MQDLQSPSKRPDFTSESVCATSSSADTALVKSIPTLQPAKETFRILTMKGLTIRSIIYNRYYYNLNCDASWVVETGMSKTQDKSRIINIIIPFIKQYCTPADYIVLDSSKPDTSTVEFNEWNTNLRKISLDIEKRLENQLEEEEDAYFPQRDKSTLRRKHMFVNAVEKRLADIRKAKNIHESHSITSYCNTASAPSTVSATSSSSSSSSISSSSSSSSSSRTVLKGAKKNTAKQQTGQKSKSIISAFIKK